MFALKATQSQIFSLGGNIGRSERVLFWHITVILSYLQFVIEVHSILRKGHQNDPSKLSSVHKVIRETNQSKLNYCINYTV